MPFENLTIQADDKESAKKWLQDLADSLVWLYSEDVVNRFQAALNARLGRPDVRPFVAEDGGMYFVQLIERVQYLSNEQLPEWLRGVPLLEDLLEREIVQVQLVERLVLPDPVDVQA